MNTFFILMPKISNLAIMRLIMSTKIEFDNLLEKLKSERDELKLKLHLASMEGKEEFEEAEKNWDKLKTEVSQFFADINIREC